MKIEERELTEFEFYKLLMSAPLDELTTIYDVAAYYKMEPYEFFKTLGIKHYGLILNGTPIYFGVGLKDVNNRIWIWTIRKKEIKEQITLYKHCKRYVKRCVKELNQDLYACTKQECPEIHRWNEKMGFKRFDENNQYVYYKLDKEE